MANPFEELQAQLTRIEGLMLQILSAQQKPAPATGPDTEQPIGLDEVARLLNLSRSAVYQNPAIPRHKRHNRLRFFKSEILAYIRANGGSPAQPQPAAPSRSKRINA